MDPATYIEKLIASGKDGRQVEYIDNLAMEEPSLLISIFEALQRLPNKSFESDRILTVLSLSTQKAYTQLLLKLIDLIYPKSRVSKYISMLCATHAPNKLFEILFNHAEHINESFIVVLSHEFISRGYDLRHTEYYDLLFKLNSKTDFKALTLFPLHTELDLTHRTFTLNMSSSSGCFGLYELQFTSFAAFGKGTYLTTLEKDPSLVVALRNWQIGPDGYTTIGYKGSISKRTNPASILKKIDIFKHSEKYKMKSIDPKTVFSRLFDAASKGGAYNQGDGGGTGRLNTWISIHNMISDAPMVSNEDTEKLMQTFNWYEFLTTGWFYNEINDLGILATDKNSNRFSIVAGKNTD